jgi:hypothetical protein
MEKEDSERVAKNIKLFPSIGFKSKVKVLSNFALKVI